MVGGDPRGYQTSDKKNALAVGLTLESINRTSGKPVLCTDILLHRDLGGTAVDPGKL